MIFINAFRRQWTAKPNKWLRRNSQSFTYALRYKDENGQRKYESLSHTNLRKAERQRAQKEKELRMDYIEPCSMKLRDFTENSLEKTGDQIRENTRRIAKRAIKDFIATIGNIDFQSVTLAHGELYRQARLDLGKSNATVKKDLAAIKNLFTLSVLRGQLDENPLRYIAMPKSQNKKINIYRDDQCQRIQKAAQEYTAKCNRETSIVWDLLITVA